MKTFLAFLMAFAIAACGTASEQAKTPAQRVFAAQADYNALLAAAVAYESQPRCAEGQSRLARCSDPKVVEKIREADNLAFTAITAARNAVRTPGSSASDVSLAVNSAVSGIGLLRTVLLTYGVMK